MPANMTQTGINQMLQTLIQVQMAFLASQKKLPKMHAHTFSIHADFILRVQVLAAASHLHVLQPLQLHMHLLASHIRAKRSRSRTWQLTGPLATIACIAIANNALKR